jgi:DNA-binding LytR/AlgR family response regulator
VIIDDEPHAVEALKKYVSKNEKLILVNFFTDPIAALQNLLNSDPVDLVLLDVDMPEISGIELAKMIRQKTSKLVFTTAHTKYAFQAFKVKADDYLLKPYTLATFMSTVESLFPNLRLEIDHNHSLARNTNFFLIKSKEDNLKLVKVRYDEIVAIESKLNYVLVVTTSTNVLTYMSLTEISCKLTPEMGFIQLHRSFILNTQHISSIEGNTITMDNGKRVSVGDYYRKDFMDFINTRLLKGKRKN